MIWVCVLYVLKTVLQQYRDATIRASHKLCCQLVFKFVISFRVLNNRNVNQEAKTEKLFTRVSLWDEEM